MQSDKTIDASGLTTLGAALYALRSYHGGEYDKILIRPQILFDAFNQITVLTKALDNIKNAVDVEYEQSL